MFSHKIIRVKWIFLVFLPKMGVHKKAFTPFWLKPWPRETFCGRDIYTSTTEIPYQKPKICLESGQHLRLVDGVVAKVKCKDNEFMTKKSIFLEHITPINSKEIYIWNPMTTRSILLCNHWVTLSVWYFCHWRVEISEDWREMALFAG